MGCTTILENCFKEISLKVANMCILSSHSLILALLSNTQYYLREEVRCTFRASFVTQKTFIDSNYCILPNIPIEGHCLLESLLKEREING